MSSSFAPLAGFESRDVIGWRHGRPIAAGEFCAAALALAERLPRVPQIVNLCEDRVSFALGFVATLLAGSTSVLPPSRAEGVLRELLANEPAGLCLTDQEGLPADLSAWRLPPWPKGAAAPERMPAIADDLTAVILFTSGSTGRPQPHAKSWRSLATAARLLAGRLGIAAGGGFSIVGTVPPQHMYGLETTVMLPLQSGMALHAGRPLLPADIAASLAELPAPRWLATTPIHLRGCVAGALELPALSGILSATMPLPIDLARAVEERLHAPLTEIYGCTEAGVVGLRRTAIEERWRATAGMRIRCASEATWIAGEQLDRELQLPDRLELFDDGEFALAGRPEDMVKIAGKRASLAALNAELERLPGVRDGAFFVPRSSSGGNRLAAVVVAPGLTRAKILSALRGRIDAAFLPRPLLFVDALPRNPTGKLERDALLAFAREAQRRKRHAP